MRINRIWKQPLVLEGGVITVVEHAGILHVGIDPNGVPCVWFWAPKEDAREDWKTSHIILVGTGIAADQEAGRYIGTFVWRTLVLHAFEEVVSGD